MTALVALLVLGPKPIPAKVDEVLKDPAKFDGKSIAVKGKVEDFRAKVSQAGNAYTTFDLLDGKEKLHVFLANKPEKPLEEGDKVTVTGRFAKEKKVGSLTFKNEIDASAKIDKVFGVKKGG